MKKITLVLLTASISLATLPHHAFAKPPVHKGDAKKSEENADPTKKPPFNGMTKAQARQRYGDPYSISSTSQGETWVYHLNMGEVIGKAFIPFYFGKNNVRVGVLMFNGSGKVIQYNWDTE